MNCTRVLTVALLAFFSIPAWSQPGIMTTIAGTGTPGFSGDGGAATACKLKGPNNVMTTAAGDIYITDELNQRVRKVKPDGLINTVAGSGVTGFGGNGGPATAASMNTPGGTLLLPSGDLLVSDLLNHQIRKVSPSGIITAFAGTGTGGYSGDGGAATAAKFNRPYGLAMDAAGNIYVADQYNHRVRKISPGGIVTTIAGTGVLAYSGDGGPATAATIKYPNYVCVSPAGDIYFTDNGNQAIRKINSSGTISTVAGSGVVGFAGDGGPATLARLNFPGGVVVDASGNLYISDYLNNRIRKVTPAGIISTIAGTGAAGSAGDGGPATAAQLSSPISIALTTAGDMLIADYNNNRIRKIGGVVPVSAPTFTGPEPYSVQYCVSEAIVAYAVDTLLKASDADLGQTLTWSIVVPPSHGTAVIAYSTSSTGGVVTPTGTTYTPVLAYTGPDMYRVRVSDGGQADTITINVTMLTAPMPAVISGADTVCEGASISLSGTASGVWGSANGKTTVLGTGTVYGVIPGADTILLTVSNTCGNATTRHPVWVKDAADCMTFATQISEPAINMYPNPMHTEFVIEIEAPAEQAEVAMYNSIGQRVKQVNIPISRKIPLSIDLPPGIYYVVATWEGGTLKSSIVVER